MMPVATVLGPEVSRVKIGHAYAVIGDRGLPSLKEIEALLSHPDGLAHLGLWTLLLRLATDGRAPGFVLDASGQPLAVPALARMAGVSQDVAGEATKRLLDRGCLDIARGYRALLSLRAFIYDTCDTRGDYWVGCRVLYEMYRKWSSSAPGEFPLTRTDFVRLVAGLGYKVSRSRRVSGKQLSTWEGLQPRTASLVK